MLIRIFKGSEKSQHILEHVQDQEFLVNCLNGILRTIIKENGTRDKKLASLRNLINESEQEFSFDLVDFFTPIPIITDPNIKSIGIDSEKTTMFKSNLMPFKFVFKTLPYLTNPNDNASTINSEYSVIYKIGDDLRQDQLILQMISLFDQVYSNIKSLRLHTSKHK